MNNNKISLIDWTKSFIKIDKYELVVKTGFSEVFKFYNNDNIYYAKSVIGSLMSEPIMFNLIKKNIGLNISPEVIALDNNLGYFLTKNLGKLTLREKFDNDGFNINLICKAYEKMYELQNSLSMNVEECISCGSSDWRDDKLAKEFIGMLESPSFSKTHGLNEKDIELARSGYEIILNSISEIKSITNRDIWSDDDFNDKNIVIIDSDFGFLDLGETSIGTPLIGIYASMNSLKMKYGISNDSKESVKFRDAYLDTYGIQSNHRESVWNACRNAYPIYGSICLNRLVLNSNSKELLVGKYKNRMKETLSMISYL